ncbi:unnamed protein product [Symbiodinium sp. CCMP2592]|nr:unnamed protein product [Symbiodinium sp. CCMP2592]
MDRVSLTAVHKEWDGCEGVRAYYRNNRRLFRGYEEGCCDPKCVVATAALNKLVLIPLLKRMAASVGRQLYTIKMLETERLAMHFLLFPLNLYIYKFSIIVGTSINTCKTNSYIRMKALHKLIFPNHEIVKADVKKDAWLARSFAVLVKRKLQRGKKSGNPDFNELLDILRGGPPVDPDDHRDSDDDGDDDDDDGDDSPCVPAGDLSGEQLDELDRELGLGSGSEAMVEAVSPADGDPLEEFLAESPADEPATLGNTMPDDDPLAEMLAEFPSPTDAAADASTAKPMEVVEVLESPVKAEPVSPERTKKQPKAHVFEDGEELRKVSEELAALKAKQSQRQDAATSLAVAGDADGKSLCKLLGLSEPSSGAMGCTDNVETQMTDEGMMDAIAEKHRATDVSMDLQSSPETGKKDGKKKPSELPVVTRREQMGLKAKMKEDKLEKQEAKASAKAKGKSQKKPPSDNAEEAANPPPPLKKTKPVIWGSPQCKKRRGQKMNDDQKSDAPDHASEACPTEFYEPPAPKKKKVMKRPSAKMSKEPQEDPEPKDQITIEPSNPILQKKTFARRFCPAGQWSQLKWLTIRKMFIHKLYKDKFFDACTVYLDTTALPVCAETIEDRISEAASNFLMEYGFPEAVP